MNGVGTRILAVEDDERIRAAVRLALEDEGWTVQEADSGEAAVDLFQAEAPDVVLIDIMLPGIDGFELCRTLRRTSDVPIVMVTARNDTHDIVAGLEAGADDYLTKPFAPKELSARIRALLRRIRPSSKGHAHLVFGDLELIPEEGKVTRNGTEVHLTKTEFRLLCELAENPGKVFSREALLDKVWGYDYFGDGRLVDVHVRRLRTKIENDPANPRHVVTVRGTRISTATVSDAVATGRWSPATTNRSWHAEDGSGSPGRARSACATASCSPSRSDRWGCPPFLAVTTFGLVALEPAVATRRHGDRHRLSRRADRAAASCAAHRRVRRPPRKSSTTRESSERARAVSGRLHLR